MSSSNRTLSAQLLTRSSKMLRFASPMLLICAGLLACGGTVTDQGDPNCGGGGGGTHEPPAPEPPLIAAAGVYIRSISINQAVGRPIMSAGNTLTDGTPIIAGREALLRVHYTLDEQYDGEPVVAELRIEGQPTATKQLSLSGTSSEAVLESTINFKLRADMVSETLNYRVDITPSEGGLLKSNPAARFPQNTEAWSKLAAVRTRLNVVLVPIAYGADGSNRLPDTSTGQLERMRNTLSTMYPVADLSITVREAPFNWSGAMAANGDGWGDMLTAIADLRDKDGVTSDTYYYGLVNPASNFSDFCVQGCVAGLGFQTGPQDVWARASIGIGFKGDLTADVWAHEEGHNHGLDHAPCGVDGDPEYPYGGASIGSFGYNSITQKLLPPTEYVDLMSYCDPAWISDWTFTRLQERMSSVTTDATAQSNVQQASPMQQDTQATAPMARMLINGNGEARWLSDITTRTQGGTQVQLHFDDDAQTHAGQFYKFDHVDGGVLMVPAAKASRDADEITVAIDGQARRLVTRQ